MRKILIFTIALLGVGSVLEAQPEDKGIVSSSLFVTVRSEFGRPIQDARVTIMGPSGSRTAGAPQVGVYSFVSLNEGNYSLRIVTPYFEDFTAPVVRVDNLIVSYEATILLDIEQVPNSLLDDFTSFDLNLDGVIEPEEEAAAFPGTMDGVLAVQDSCNCPLIPREIARVLDRPFLTIAPVRDYGSAAYPGAAMDYGEIPTNEMIQREITIRNEGGGQLQGGAVLNPNAPAKNFLDGFTLTMSESNYTLGQDQELVIRLDLMVEEPMVYSSMLSLGGNYDGEPVLIGIRGTAVEASAPVGGCPGAGTTEQDVASTGMMAVLLLSVFAAASRRRR